MEQANKTTNTSNTATERTMEDVISEYPHLFAERNAGFGGLPHYTEYIKILCSYIDKIFKYSRYIKFKVPIDNKEYGPPPKDAVICQFVQIKEKFGTPRFYVDLTITEWDELPEAFRNDYDKDDYIKYVNSIRNQIYGVISFAEYTACNYKLISVNKV